VIVELTLAGYEALPNRAELVFDPIEGRDYRDPTWPDLVFRCDNASPALWSAFTWAEPLPASRDQG